MVMRSDFHHVLTEQVIGEYKKQIEDGIEAESILADYNDFFISICNESCLLPADSCEPKRDSRTVFKILPACDHLCATSLSSVSVRCANNDISNYNRHCCNLVNAVKRHVCNNYCSKKGDCWFSYPKPTVSCSHV